MKHNFGLVALVLALAVSTSAWSASIASVAPNTGPTTGGTTVYVTGTGINFLPGVSNVIFGSNNATGVFVLSSTILQATVPASASAGAVNVSVTGASFPTISLSNGFTYYTSAAPVITSSLTATGTVGTPFNYTVTASGAPASNFTVGTLPTGLLFSTISNSIYGTPLSGAAGITNVTLTASNGVLPNNSKVLVITITPAPAAPVISSSLTATGTVGTPFNYTVTASGFPTSTFNASPLPGGLLFSTISNSIYGIPTAVTPPGGFNVTLTASNGVPPDDNKTLVITVTDPPVITSPLTASGTVGSPFSYTITASGTPASTFTTGPFLPAGLQFSAVSSLIFGTPTAEYASGFNVALTASNGSPPNDSKILVITIKASPIITSSLVVGATAGTGFTYLITATGSTPMTFSIDPLTPLPPGLTFFGSAISGTPTTVGVTSVNVTASNGSLPNDTKTLVFTVYATNTAPVVTSVLTASGIKGTPFSYTLTASGTPTIVYTASPLPAGLSLTGFTISGTPTAGGVTNVILTAANGTAPNDSKTLVITIYAAPVITSASTATATVGLPFSYPITASGTTPITYTIDPLTPLPAGLSFITGVNLGTISGTPTTAGVTSVTLNASNGTLPDNSKTLVITVKAPPLITSVLTASVVVGTSFSYSITATGDAPITYTTSSLPPGLALSGSAISGTPTVPGFYNVILIASNGVLPNDSKTLVITVTQAPVITSSLVIAAVAQAPFLYTITASGVPVSTFTASPLPDGLTLTGAIISGTPTTPGVTSVVLTASNGTSPNDSKTLVITVASAPPLVNSALSASGVVGTVFSYTITASGSLPITFAASPLPAGLILSGNTILGVPTEAGITSVVLKVTNGTLPDNSKPLVITITAPPVISSVLTASGVVGTAFNYIITTTGSLPVVFTSSPLPAGLTLNNTLGTISGVPTSAGVTNVILIASNGTLPKNSKTLVMTITNGGGVTGAPVITSMTLTPSPAKATQQVTAVGVATSTAGTVTYSWNFGDGSSAVSGTPATHTYSAKGTYPVTLTATAGGLSSTQTISLVVESGPTVIPGLMSSITFKDAYTVKAVRGEEVDSSALSLNAKITLPSGTTISDSDVLSISAGGYSFSNTLSHADTIKSGKYTFKQDDKVTVSLSRNVLTVTASSKNFTTILVSSSDTGALQGSIPISIVFGKFTANFNAIYKGKASFKTNKNLIDVGSSSVSGADKAGTVSQ